MRALDELRLIGGQAFEQALGGATSILRALTSPQQEWKQARRIVIMGTGT
jgi:hypothetical protein